MARLAEMQRRLSTVVGALCAPKVGLAIWAFAIAARLLAVGLQWGRPLVDDALMQHEMAVALSDGRLETYWPPGVALYLTGVVELFGRSHDVSRLAMLPWSVAMLDVTRRLGVVLGREAGGRLALLLASLFPGFVLHGSVTLTHLPCAVCMGYAALLATELGTDRIERRVLATWALLGLVLGIGTLVRSSILAYAFGLPLLVAITQKLWRRRADAWARPFVAIAVTALIVSAHSAAVYAKNGRWVLLADSNSQNIYYGNNPWTPTYKTWWFGSHKWPEPTVPAEFQAELESIQALPVDERGDAFVGKAKQHLEDRPDLAVVRTAARARTFFAFDTFTGTYSMNKLGVPRLLAFGLLAADALLYLAAFLGMLGYFGLQVAGARAGKQVARCAIALALPPYLLAFSHPTYHLPILPIVLAAAGAFVAHLASGAQLTRLRALIAVALALAFLAVQVEWVLRVGG